MTVHDQVIPAKDDEIKENIEVAFDKAFQLTLEVGGNKKASVVNFDYGR